MGLRKIHRRRFERADACVRDGWTRTYHSQLARRSHTATARASSPRELLGEIVTRRAYVRVQTSSLARLSLAGKAVHRAVDGRREAPGTRRAAYFSGGSSFTAIAQFRPISLVVPFALFTGDVASRRESQEDATRVRWEKEGSQRTNRIIEKSRDVQINTWSPKFVRTPATNGRGLVSSSDMCERFWRIFAYVRKILHGYREVSCARARARIKIRIQTKRDADRVSTGARYARYSLIYHSHTSSPFHCREKRKHRPSSPRLSRTGLVRGLKSFEERISWTLLSVGRGGSSLLLLQ